jgi:hypothetical protein
MKKKAEKPALENIGLSVVLKLMKMVNKQKLLIQTNV